MHFLNLKKNLQKLNAGVKVYSDLIKNSVTNELEEETAMMKLDILKDDLLQTSMKVHKQVQKEISHLENES